MIGWHLVWHQNDLRLHDNPALTAAAKQGKVLPLYIHNPKDRDAWRIGSASKWWLHHSLTSLDEAYKEHGLRLILRTGSAKQVFQQLAKELDIAAVYWNQRYEPERRQEARTIADLLEREGIEIERFEGNYLITPTRILNKSGKPYSVFTPFSKAVLADGSWRTPLRRPTLEAARLPKSVPLKELDLLPERGWADSFHDHWQPGRAGAEKKLKGFSKVAGEYKTQRDFPADLGTSRLSPHLHFGEISPHEIWHKVDEEPYRRQLIWREFGNYFLFHNPAATDLSWKEMFDQFPWEENRAALEKWQKGLTGYPIVDAGMRELWETGWMHNRVRMIVGSFLIKDLFIHWREGARWFWDTLVDADLGNNTLGWQWVAGSGPDAAPYFRVFNPTLQGQKFDPDGVYVRQWVPELASLPKKWIHTPWEAPTPPADYPPPIVDHAQARDKALEAYHRLKG